MLLPFVACRQNDQIGRNRLAAPHPRSVSDKCFDVRELCQGDLAFYDQIGAADIEIITAASGKILELPARTIFSEIEPEAFALEPIEQILVQLLCLLREQDVTSLCDRKRDGSRDKVAVLQRRTFIIERVGQLGAWLNIDDQRRAALNGGEIIMAQPSPLSVLSDALKIADKFTITLEAVGNKIRANSQGWDDARVLTERQVAMVVAEFVTTPITMGGGFSVEARDDYCTMVVQRMAVLATLWPRLPKSRPSSMPMHRKDRLEEKQKVGGPALASRFIFRRALGLANQIKS